jgi:hypothetical protein
MHWAKCEISVPSCSRHFVCYVKIWTWRVIWNSVSAHKLFASCHLRIPHGCVSIDSRESGNTNVEWLSLLGRASSDNVWTVCNYKESASLTVHYYRHVLLRGWTVTIDYYRLMSVSVDCYRHVLLRGRTVAIDYYRLMPVSVDCNRHVLLRGRTVTIDYYRLMPFCRLLSRAPPRLDCCYRLLSINACFCRLLSSVLLRGWTVTIDYYRLMSVSVDCYRHVLLRDELLLVIIIDRITNSCCARYNTSTHFFADPPTNTRLVFWPWADFFWPRIASASM